MARKTFIALIVMVAFCGKTSAAEWEQFKPGPSFDEVEAFCDNQAMMAGSYNPQRLGNVGPSLGMGMVDLGGGIGSLIRRSKFKKNCMIMNGWRPAKAKNTKKKKNHFSQ